MQQRLNGKENTTRGNAIREKRGDEFDESR